MWAAFDQALAHYRNKFTSGAKPRPMDPDKLCQTMFLSGLYLNCQSATQVKQMSKVVDTIDSIVEHPSWQQG